MQIVIDIDDKLYKRIKYLEPRADTMLDELMRSVQSGTPQSKTGYWIRCDILQELKCSECRRCFRNKTNFCPNCGARMEVEE